VKPIIELRPIGVIHSPFREPQGTPIQPVVAGGAAGSITLFEEYAEGLKDLDGFERIWLVYCFDRAPEARLLVTPFLDTVARGIFATRSPARPNRIGISCVRLTSVEGNTLHVADIDVVDGTPLLDIKPYVPRFDCFEESRAGWFDETRLERRVADERFVQPAAAAPKAG